MANAKEARIDMYIHCATCLKIEEEDGVKTPVDYGESLAVGWTREGFQVVCENCGKNVIDLDFLGQKVTYYDKKATDADREKELNLRMKTSGWTRAKEKKTCSGNCKRCVNCHKKMKKDD